MEIQISNEVKESVALALREVEKMQVIEIKNQQEFETSEAMLKVCRDKIKYLETEENKILKPQKEAMNATKELFKPAKTAWEFLLEKVNSARKYYLNIKEQERLRLERELREKAEKEAREQREALLREAAKTRDKEKAKELKQEAKAVIPAPAPVVQSSAVMADKRMNRKVVKITVKDMSEVLKHIIKTRNYGYIILNEPPIKAEYLSKEGNLEIPGLEIKYEY